MRDRRSPLDLPKPVDVQSALAEALDVLAPVLTEHALIGGVALAVHGIERFTKDVDLAVTVGQTGRAEQVLSGRDVRPLKIGGISVGTTSGVRVDLIDHRFEYRVLYEKSINAARESGCFVRVGSHDVPVVSIEHLLAMKLGAGRPQDERDALSILAKPELDYRAARTIVADHLGHFAARYLDRLAREAGRSDAPRDCDTSK